MDIVKYSRDSSFQRIKAWYIDHTSVKLSEKEIQKKDTLVHIWGLRINNKFSKNQVIQIAMRDYNLSQPTAYRYYSLSQQLFGELDAVNLEAERIVLAESYWNIYQRCINSENFDAARKALDSYKSLFPFGDNSQKIDPKKLEASVYKLILPRGTGKILSKMVESGSVDFNSLDYTDAEWSNVDDIQDEDLEENE